MVVVDGWLVYKRQAYSAEIARLQADMTRAERSRTELIIANEEDKIRLAIELARRQARRDERLHLAVPVDSGRMYLEREGAILREMRAEFGEEKTVGTEPDTIRLALPRGERTVREILLNESWAAPEWVYMDRGLPPDSASALAGARGAMAGALGPIALLLEGGTLIYSTPSVGPLADSLYILPGSVRMAVEDLRAVLPNIQPGMKVYFH